MTSPYPFSTLARKYRLDVDLGTADLTTKTATGVASTDLFTLAAHGLLEGQAITISAGPTGVTAGVKYVRDVTTNTFKVTGTQGGVALDVTADGNLVFVKGPVWAKVWAISEFTPKIDSNLEDDTDYDSAGWTSQTKTQLAWMIETKAFRKVNGSGTYDPGQEKLRAASEAFGAAGTAHVRWYDLNGSTEAYEGLAEVTWSPDGGNTKDLSSVSVTLTGKGARTAITNPSLP